MSLARLAELAIELGEAYNSIGRPLLELLRSAPMCARCGSSERAGERCASCGSEALLERVTTGQIHELGDRLSAAVARGGAAVQLARRLHRIASTNPNR